MVEDRGNTWDLEALASFIIIGFISRIIGFILRTVVIFLGLVSLFATIASGLIIHVFWIVAPIAIIGILGFGLTLIAL